MDISAISSSLLQQIGNSATASGDAVTVSVMRKALDIQSAQAAQMIESLSSPRPDPAGRVGRHLDIRA